jgi:histidine ammonia-lyase
LSEKSWKRVKLARGVINDIIERKEVVYGVNTGFGNFANTIISPENLV